MFYYGRRSKRSLDNLLKNRSYKIQLRIKSSSIQLRRNLSYYSHKTFIYVPNSWFVSILSKNCTVKPGALLYLYNNTYFVSVPLGISKGLLMFDMQSRTILLNTQLSPSFYNFYRNEVLSIFYGFSRILFKKIKFKGKGYYVFKNTRNTVTPQFGHAHRIYLYSYFIAIKFLSKTSVFVFGLSKTDLLGTCYALLNAKPVNIFTGRGVRFSRQVIYKKTGKVSSYR